MEKPIFGTWLSSVAFRHTINHFLHVPGDPEGIRGRSSLFSFSQQRDRHEGRPLVSSNYRWPSVDRECLKRLTQWKFSHFVISSLSSLFQLFCTHPHPPFDRPFTITRKPSNPSALRSSTFVHVIRLRWTFKRDRARQSFSRPNPADRVRESNICSAGRTFVSGGPKKITQFSYTMVPSVFDRIPELRTRKRIPEKKTHFVRMTIYMDRVYYRCVREYLNIAKILENHIFLIFSQLYKTKIFLLIFIFNLELC